MTEGVLAKLKEAFRAGATKREACYYSGINESTLYRYIEKNPSFAMQIETWEMEIVIAARFNIYEEIVTKKSIRDSWLYLRAKRPKEFSERYIVSRGEPVKAVTVDELERAARAGVIIQPR